MATPSCGNPERDHVIAMLREAGRLGGERYIEASSPVGTRFVTDGRIVHAILTSYARGVGHSSGSQPVAGLVVEGDLLLARVDVRVIA